MPFHCIAQNAKIAIFTNFLLCVGALIQKYICIVKLKSTMFEHLSKPQDSSIGSISARYGKNDKPTIIGGFYREWSQNGQNSEAAQLDRIEI